MRGAMAGRSAMDCALAGAAELIFLQAICLRRAMERRVSSIFLPAGGYGAASGAGGEALCLLLVGQHGPAVEEEGEEEEGHEVGPKPTRKASNRKRIRVLSKDWMENYHTKP